MGADAHGRDGVSPAARGNGAGPLVELENRVGTPGHLDRCWLDVEFKRAHRDETISPGSAEAA